MKIFGFKGGSNMSKKKKIFVLVAMVLLLVVTGYLNIALSSSSGETATSTTASSASLLTAYRNNKLATRTTMLEYYNSIIESDCSQEQKDEATSLKLDLAKRMETETILESMVMASGYEDAVVTIADETTSVMVKSDGLDSNQVSKILAILVNQTQVSATNVKIMSV